MEFKTIIEPFKIKSVEPIKMTTPDERKVYLEKAKYNPFKLESDQVMIDFLTDSGTSAMSANQWAGIMIGDESYAGSKSWEHMHSTIKDLTRSSSAILTLIQHVLTLNIQAQLLSIFQYLRQHIQRIIILSKVIWI